MRSGRMAKYEPESLGSSVGVRWMGASVPRSGCVCAGPSDWGGVGCSSRQPEHTPPGSARQPRTARPFVALEPMAEWNTQRLKRLLATHPQVIKEAATRDGTLHEAQVFAAELARALGPPPDPEAKPEAELALNLKVISVDGSEIFFKAKPSTPFTKLTRAYCQRQGLNEDAVRFIFDGQRIPQPGLTTPAECEMEDGDVIAVVTEMVGGCIASPVPALFGCHPFDSPGIAYLDGSAASTDATSAESTALIEHLGGSLTDAPQILSAPLLDAAACAGLVDYINKRAAASHGPSHDLSLPADIRLTASEAEMTAVLGTSHLAALRTAFGGDSTFDTVKLRRVTGPLGCVPFHTDYSKRTLHVALNDDYEGGCVVFATANGFVQPARPTGSATLHVNCVLSCTASRRFSAARATVSSSVTRRTKALTPSTRSRTS